MSDCGQDPRRPGAGTLRAMRAYAGLGTRLLGARLGGRRPFKITWMLTERCDCRCTGCFIWKRPKGHEVTPDDVERVLRAAPSLRWINLTGGELFLRDDMPALAAAAVRARPDLAVLDFPTTGQRTDRILADVEEMCRLPIPRFYVTCSIEGPPELHDTLRGRPGAFDNLMATYQGLRAMDGVHVFLGMTLSDRNVDAVDATFEAVRDHVPDVTWRDVHFNVYTESGHYYDNEDADVGIPASLDRVLQRALRARTARWSPADAIEASYLRLLPEYLRTGRSPLPCQSLRVNVFVDANGDVHPCTVYGRVLGNVLTTPLYEILDGSEAQAARDVIAADACPGCWSPCEAHPTIVATAPESLLRRPRRGAGLRASR